MTNARTGNNRAGDMPSQSRYPEARYPEAPYPEAPYRETPYLGTSLPGAPPPAVPFDGAPEPHATIRDVNEFDGSFNFTGESSARKLLDIGLRAAIDQKSFDVRGLDVTAVADFTDFFLIASGTSLRHVQGIADKVSTELRKLGVRPYATTGYDNGEWIVLDYGDFVAHVFYEPTRQFYEFDELWNSAAPIELEPQLALEARALRTGKFR